MSFFAPAKVGELIGDGKILHLGKSVAFLEGSLFGYDGQIVARATASARLVSTSRL